MNDLLSYFSLLGIVNVLQFLKFNITQKLWHFQWFQTFSAQTFFLMPSSIPFRDQWDQVLIFETESETTIFRVSISRPNQRPKFPESQFWDWVRDWIFLSLNVKTQFQTKNFSVLILRLSLRHEVPVSQLWDMVGYRNFVRVFIKIESETRFFWSWL